MGGMPVPSRRTRSNSAARCVLRPPPSSRDGQLHLGRRRASGVRRSTARRPGAGRCRFTKFISAPGGVEGGTASWAMTRLAEQLIPYVADMGFTHIELLPIFRASARCLLGLSADWPVLPPPADFGAPAGFARFVDRRASAQVSASSWTGCRLTSDRRAWARLVRWERRSMSIPDPRRGFHPDWNTAIYDFGRREVASILTSNAMYLARSLSTSMACASMRSRPCSISTIHGAGRMAARTPRREREPRRDTLPSIGE